MNFVLLNVSVIKHKYLICLTSYYKTYINSHFLINFDTYQL